MAEILSQSEIDALLSEIESGESLEPTDKQENRKRQISVYDFRHPNLVSKEHLRILQMVHERFAKLVESYLSTKLRSLVDVKLIAVDQVTYSEFMLSISDPSCIYILRIEELSGEAIIEITLPVVFFIVDRLFGGGGKGFEKLREMTLIEQQVLARVSQYFAEALSKSWVQIVPFNAVIKAYQSRPSFIQIAPLEEMVISISLEVNVQETSGFVNLCFPLQLFEDILPKMSSQQMVRSRTIKKNPEDSQAIRKSVRSASIPIHAELGRRQITLEELIQLEVGDVIRLDTNTNKETLIFVDKSPWFTGKPGIFNRKMALEINRLLRDHERS